MKFSGDILLNKDTETGRHMKTAVIATGTAPTEKVHKMILQQKEH